MLARPSPPRLLTTSLNTVSTVVRLRAAKAKTIKEQDVTEALKVFDKDGNGYIKTDEVKRILSQLGEKLSAREVEAIIAEADPRRSGQVPYDFFVGMVGPPPPALLMCCA